MADETIVDETTTSETIKYSKTETVKNESGEEETKTTNVFENFEPWRYGEPAIPTELYFLGTDEKANGYQQYFNTNSYGVEEINATGSGAMSLFEINGKPIRGCVKGTVVTAVKKLDSSQLNVDIWMEDGIAYYKIENNKDKTELKTADGMVPKRLGIVIVGGGGACGACETEKWKNECHQFYTTMPGGGGGGGGIIWGIINLELSDKDNVYTIKTGSGGLSSGVSGWSTILSHKKVGTLAIAGGGGGGGKGRKSGAVGGAGGICAFTTDTKYFIKCGQKTGGQGGSYSELDIENEEQSINSIVEANNFDISFIPDGNKKNAGSDAHDGAGATISKIIEERGNVYLAVPGGNSFENGGYSSAPKSIVAPGFGGGGMSWTYQGESPENIWSAIDMESAKARRGADGGWILFY